MRFLFFVVVAVVAIAAGVVALQFSGGQQPPPPIATKTQIIEEPTIKTADILVAKTDIAVGTKIDANMVDIQPWPENLVLDNFILSSQSNASVIGKVARSSVQAHEPFMKSKLANPNDPGFLAANLPTGMRAVTIATDVVAGIAGFVFPGDHVDLLFTHGIEDVDGKLGVRAIHETEVLAANVRVLAVNLRGSDAPVPDGNGSTKPAPVPSPTSITVEVSDAVAQKLRLAEKLGTISLALRSIHDDNEKSPPPAGIEDLTQGTSESHAEKANISVIRGPGSSTAGKITASSGNSDYSSAADKSKEGADNHGSVPGGVGGGLSVVK